MDNISKILSIKLNNKLEKQNIEYLNTNSVIFLCNIINIIFDNFGNIVRKDLLKFVMD